MGSVDERPETPPLHHPIISIVPGMGLMRLIAPTRITRRTGRCVFGMTG
jgi:hypothetical protein